MTNSHAVAACSPLMKVEDSCRDLHTATLCPSPEIILLAANASCLLDVHSRSQDPHSQELRTPSRSEKCYSSRHRCP